MKSDMTGDSERVGSIDWHGGAAICALEMAREVLDMALFDLDCGIRSLGNEKATSKEDVGLLRNLHSACTEVRSLVNELARQATMTLYDLGCQMDSGSIEFGADE